MEKASIGETCGVAGCGKQKKGRGLCSMHYARLMKYGSTEPPDLRRLYNQSGCQVEECPNEAITKGMCARHYNYWRRHGRTEPVPRQPQCSVSDCGRGTKARGLCGMHYTRMRLHGSTDDRPRQRPINGGNCSIQGCDTPASARGWCQKHYSRWLRHGDPTKTIRGKGTLNHGYRLLYRPDHPMAPKSGQIREHRLVMAEMIGRPLLPEEKVHHKNGVRSDNRPSNLELWNVSHPPGQRAADKVAWAMHILELYPPEVLQAADGSITFDRA